MILEYLKSQTRGKSIEQIAYALALSEAEVQKEIQLLRQDGWVRKAKRRWFYAGDFTCQGCGKSFPEVKCYQACFCLQCHGERYLIKRETPSTSSRFVSEEVGAWDGARSQEWLSRPLA